LREYRATAYDGTPEQSAAIYGVTRLASVCHWNSFWRRPRVDIPTPVRFVRQYTLPARKMFLPVHDQPEHYPGWLLPKTPKQITSPGKHVESTDWMVLHLPVQLAGETGHMGYWTGI
jgi:hypothetical protein